MATYNEVYDEIINTLMGRPEGTEVQPDEHQNFALALLDYIRSVELMGSSVFQGPANVSTVPLEPENSNLAYTSFAPSNQTTYWVHFIGQDGQAVHVTMDEGHVGIVILYWNKEYWSAQVIAVPIAAIDVVNNLDTDDAYKALSAAMGKLLNEKKLEAEDYESEVEEMPSNYYTKDEVRALINSHNINQEEELRRFEQTIRQEINSYRPIVINGNVVNAPDEEDITTDENHLLKLKNRSGLNGMGYIIVRQDETFKNQVDVSQAGVVGTIYEIRYDFDLGGATVTLPADCVLNFTGGKLTNGTLVMNNTSLMGQVDLEVNTSGSCADLIGYQSWFGGIDYWHTFINNVTGVQVYEYEQGTYAPTVMINKRVTDKCVAIHGNGAQLNITYTTNRQKAICLQAIENYSGHRKLAANAVKGDLTITVEDVSLFSIGDAVCIRDEAMSSFNFDRDYQQGEYAKIRGIDITNSTLLLDHPVMGNYLHVSTDKCHVYKLYTISAAVTDLTLNVVNPDVVSTNEFFGLVIINGDGVYVRNVKSVGFTYGTSLYYSQNGTVENCRIISNKNVYSGVDNYGLSITNCQFLRIVGGEFAAGNHGIAIGGAGPSGVYIIDRYILIENTVSSSTKFDTSIDVHGCAELITIRNNFANGIDISGGFITVEGNHVVGKGGIFGSHFNNFNNKIINNIVEGGDIGVSTTDESTYTRSTENWVPQTGPEVLEISGNVFNNKSATPYNLIAQILHQSVTGYPNAANVKMNVHDNYMFNMRMIFTNAFRDGYTFAGDVEFYNNKLLYDGNVSLSSDQALRGNRVVIKNNDIDNLVRRFTVRGNSIEIIGNSLRNATGNQRGFQIDSDVNRLLVKDNFIDNSSIRLLVVTSSGIKISDMRIVGNISEYVAFDNGQIFYYDYASNTKYGTAIIMNNIVSKNVVAVIRSAERVIWKNNVDKNTGGFVKPGITPISLQYPTGACYDLDGTIASGSRDDRLDLNLDASNAGFEYYDTTLKKYTLWNGTAWTNLDGTSL